MLADGQDLHNKWCPNFSVMLAGSHQVGECSNVYFPGIFGYICNAI